VCFIYNVITCLLISYGLNGVFSYRIIPSVYDRWELLEEKCMLTNEEILAQSYTRDLDIGALIKKIFKKNE